MTTHLKYGTKFVVELKILNMKKYLFIAFYLFLGLVGTAQITVAETAKKLKMNVDEIETLEAPSATSKCGEITIKYTDTMFSGGCLGNLVRVYTYTDECGASATAEYYVQLVDTRGPEFTSIPEDVYVENGAAPLIPQLETMDNSKGKVKVEVSEETKRDRIIRTWTATDQCGNQSTTSQTVWLKASKK